MTLNAIRRQRASAKLQETEECKFRKEFLRTFGCRKWQGNRMRGHRAQLRRGRRGTQIRFSNANGNGSTLGYVPRAGSTYTASYRYALRTEFTPTRSTYA